MAHVSDILIYNGNDIWCEPFLEGDQMNAIYAQKFFDMLKNKSLRIHIRVTPETKSAWIRSCERLPGKTQSQVFRNLVDTLAATINTVNENSEVKTNETEV